MFATPKRVDITMAVANEQWAYIHYKALDKLKNEAPLASERLDQSKVAHHFD